MGGKKKELTMKGPFLHLAPTTVPLLTLVSAVRSIGKMWCSPPTRRSCCCLSPNASASLPKRQARTGAVAVFHGDALQLCKGFGFWFSCSAHWEN